MLNVREKLESELAERLGRRHCFLTNSGTAALTIALRSLCLPKKSSVMVSPLTCYAVLLAILFADLKPAFVDIHFPSLTMSRESVKNALKGDIKGIIAIHHFGQPEDMEFLSQVATKRGIFLVEDFASAFGGKIGQRMMGSFGDVSITSFGPEKILDCGGGGAILTNNEEILEECLQIMKTLPQRDHRQKRAYALRYLRSYYLLKAGFKLGISKSVLARTAAAIPKNFALARIDDEISMRIAGRLPNIEQELTSRRNNVLFLKRKLSHPFFSHSPFDTDDGTCFRYSVLVPRTLRLEFLAELQKEGIFASTLYYPNLAQLYGCSENNLQAVNEISSRIINFIIDNDRSQSDMELLAQKANSAIERLSARKRSA